MRKWTINFDISTIPDAVIQSEWARRQAAKRLTHGGGRPKVLRICPHCGAQFGSRELRQHACPAKA